MGFGTFKDEKGNNSSKRTIAILQTITGLFVFLLSTIIVVGQIKVGKAVSPLADIPPNIMNIIIVLCSGGAGLALLGNVTEWLKNKKSDDSSKDKEESE